VEQQGRRECRILNKKQGITKEDEDEDEDEEKRTANSEKWHLKTRHSKYS
jgi:hypothetical protein